jgi:hypothetical protein
MVLDSVKQFIRNVRAAKTIADERAVVQKESAAIRASFREEGKDSNIRFAHIPKMMLREREMLIFEQAQQCSKAIIPLHTRRTNTFRTD